MQNISDWHIRVSRQPLKNGYKYQDIHILRSGDGIPRTKYELDGWYRGKDGTFEYIIESDETSNHRLFRPK